jgi:thioredoxin reductase (NADPH)
MKSKEMLDVVIVGAGPIGIACGIEAERHSLSYRILEKGCRVNSIFHFPVNMTFFSTSDRLEIGDVPFISHGDKPTRREALEYYRRVTRAWNLKINTYEMVKNIKQEKVFYRIISEKSEYLTKDVIIATGYYDNPNQLDIPGESLEKTSHYFIEAHPYADQKVVVVGGGNSAVDTALECFRCGAEVTMVVREASLDKSIKYWVKPDIENRIKEGSVAAYFKASLKKIKKKEVEIEIGKKTKTIENDFVFVMTGYQPDYDFLDKVGVKCQTNRDLIPCFNPDTFETHLQGIYLAGVVCGGMDTSKWFIENAREHPKKIFEHMLRK